MSEPDDEWILLRERGEDVSHVTAATRARYDQLAVLLEQLPGETPSQGWKQRVLARLDDPPAGDVSTATPDEPPAHDGSVTLHSGRPPRRHRPHRRLWAIMGGVAMATAIAFVVALYGVRTDPSRPERVAMKLRVHVPADAGPLVTTEIRRSNTPHRSGSGIVSIGDTFVIHVTTDRPTELRVYGDTGEPLARCSEAQGCTVERDGNVRRLRLELVLRASGDVRAVLFTGASIPASFSSLNADVETAQSANVEVRQAAIVHVQ